MRGGKGKDGNSWKCINGNRDTADTRDSRCWNLEKSKLLENLGELSSMF